MSDKDTNNRLYALATIVVAVCSFMGFALWHAVQGSIIAAVILAISLVGTLLMVVQVVTVRANASDNKSLVEAIMAAQAMNNPQLPADKMYNVMKQRAAAERALHQAQETAAKTVAAPRVIEAEPTFELNDAVIDIS